MNKNYRLLTTAIVTALDASNPSMKGVIWTPAEVNDVAEAKALAQVGYAEETTEKATVKTKAEGGPPKVSGAVDAIRQEDGTYKNANGIRVNEDGSVFGDDDPYLQFLGQKADDIIGQLGEVTDEQRVTIPRLIELEKLGKDRVTVLAALESAQTPAAE